MDTVLGSDSLRSLYSTCNAYNSGYFFPSSNPFVFKRRTLSYTFGFTFTYD